MWLLKKATSDKVYILRCNKDVVIGRKDVDIVITGDSSVSRKHAIIRIVHEGENLKNPNFVPTVTVTDLSKFGTYVTGSSGLETKVDKETVLDAGVTIQFGAQDSVFKLEHVPLIIITSMLESGMKQRLQEALLCIGGHMVNGWHEKITHLVVENIKLSIKVTLALVNTCHLVTPDFIFQLKGILGTTQSAPKAEKFMPELAEPNLSHELCSFKPDTKRREVFKNRLFVYMSKKQQRRLGSTITCGGGKTVLADDPSINDEVLSDPQTAVVACGSTEEENLVVGSKRYEHIQEVLLMNSHRLIQEHEIGLAVLYCDASVYCNPDFELNSQNVFTQQPTLEANTCDVGENEKSQSEVTVPKNSNLSVAQNSASRKRSRTTDVECTGVTEEVPNLSPDGKKVKHGDDVETIPEQHPMNVPDSCLDDDNLWSQNFDSISHSHQEKDTRITPNRKEEQRPMTGKVSTPFVELTVRNNKDNIPEGGNSVEARIAQPPIPEVGNSVGAVIAQPPVKVEVVSPPPLYIPPSETKSNSGITAAVCDVKPLPQAVQGQLSSFDPDLPINLAEIGFCNLVAKRRHAETPEYTDMPGVKNFKRFRKVWPTYIAKHMSSIENISSHPPVPQIIGGSDFFVNEDRQDKSNDVMMDWFGQESQHSDPFFKISKSNVRQRT